MFEYNLDHWKQKWLDTFAFFDLDSGRELCQIQDISVTAAGMFGEGIYANLSIKRVKDSSTTVVNSRKIPPLYLRIPSRYTFYQGDIYFIKRKLAKQWRVGYCGNNYYSKFILEDWGPNFTYKAFITALDPISEPIIANKCILLDENFLLRDQFIFFRESLVGYKSGDTVNIDFPLFKETLEEPLYKLGYKCQ